MKLKSFFAAACVVALSLDAGAVRAIDKFVEVTQPDGSTLTVKKYGDERGHYLLATDGALIAERDGAYYFGTLDSRGAVTPTDVPAADPGKRSAAQTAAAMHPTAEQLDGIFLSRLSDRRNAIAQDGMGRFTSNFPRKGDIKGLVILVEYKDTKFTLPNPHEYFHGLLNTDGFSEYSATGCAAEYFRSNSNDQFRPVFDVLGPVTLSQKMSYYGGNNYYGQDSRPEEMIIESVRQLDPDVDFSVYDNDGDGELDNVFVIYAGRGEASYGTADSVWPHSWDLVAAGKSFIVDGVQVNTYGCTNEWEQTRPDGVGTFVHEFSHVMGLPDLYCTSNNYITCTPGNWSVLDYGPYNNDGCTPPNYSIYERLAMGWIEPTILDGPADVRLENIAESNQGCIIQTPKNTEYFLFENRQQTGWDTYLPGHGMLIWHIDFVQSVFDANQVNNNSSHQYVEIEKASGVKNASDFTTYAGWSWPGTKNRTQFTDATNPSMKTWTGKPLNLPITDIKEENGIITFDVAGGAPPVLPPVATVPTTGGENWFEATWLPTENATDYYVTVFEKSLDGEPQSYACDMGSGSTFDLPEGWSSSHETIYSTSGNFGAAAPSYKISNDGGWLKSPVFDTDITSISFWVKGQQAEGSYLTVTGIKADETEVEIARITPEKTTAKTEEIETVPAGVCQFVMTYTKSKGNVAVDDVVVTVGGAAYTILPDYNAVSTGGETRLIVTTPGTPGAEYQYYVTATDGEYVSAPSNRVTVPAEFEYSRVALPNTAASFGIQGRMLTASEPVVVTDLSGRVIFRGQGKYLLPSGGVYIVKGSSSVRKLVVR